MCDSRQPQEGADSAVQPWNPDATVETRGSFAYRKSVREQSIDIDSTDNDYADWRAWNAQEAG